jgi:nucleoporin POM152
LIPLITNNSEPYKLTYSIHSLSDIDAEAERIPFEGPKLIRGDRRALQKRAEEDEEDVDDYYLDGRSVAPRSSRQPHSGPLTGSTVDNLSGSPIQRSIRPNDRVSSLPRSIDPSQTIYYLPIAKTGSITLLSVQDADESVFRIQKTSRTALVIECPSGAEILGIEGESKEPEFKWKNVLVKREKDDNHVRHRCVGSDDVVQMSARGVGDLKIGYLIREGKGKDRRVIEEGVLSGIQTDAFNSASLRQPLLLKDKPEGTVEANRQVALRNSETALTLDRNLQVANAAATLPLRLPIAHRQVGTYTIELLNVTDSRGNFVRPSQSESVTFEVHALPVVSFTNHCAQPRTLRLLDNGTVTLPIIMPGARQVPDGTTKVKIAYKATIGDQAWQREYEMDGKSLAVEVGQPGTYTLESATSTYCAGVVNEPATCVVEAVPVPKAEVEMTSLSNEW